MEKTETIHLLALVDSSHDAEVLASSLRNAGHAVRHKHIEDEEDLSTAIEQDHWDILISSPKVGDYPVEHCMEAINKLGKDIPCVVIHSGEHDTATALKYIQAGATDYIPASAQNYLITIVERELNHLYER